MKHWQGRALVLAFERVAAFIDHWEQRRGFVTLRHSSTDLEAGTIVTATDDDGHALPLTVDDLAAIITAWRAPARIVTTCPPPSLDDLRAAMLSAPLLTLPPAPSFTDEQRHLIASALAERAYAEQIAGHDGRAREAFELAEQITQEAKDPPTV